jgi:Transglutaminase-like superfamily
VSGWWSKASRRLVIVRQLRGAGDWLLCVHAVLYAAAVPLLFRPSLSRVPSLLRPAATPPIPEPARVQRVLRCVDVALCVGRPLVRSTCLTRSATRYYFLRRAGMDVTLHFGVGHVDGQLVGHCWLASHGEPVLEARDPRSVYVETYRIPWTAHGSP